MVIKYSVEVEGLPVYNESYDVDTLIKEYKKDPEKAEQLWARRLKAPVECRLSPMFSSAVTTYVATGENPHQPQPKVTKEAKPKAPSKKK